jgi:hypothetical protein
MFSSVNYQTSKNSKEERKEEIVFESTKKKLSKLQDSAYTSQ